MSGSLNKVQVIGNLGKDPEVRYTGDNRAIANLTLATSERWKDQAGNQQEKTEWHKIVVFGKLAEIAEKYLHKGDTAYFEGKLQTNKWTDRDGQDRYTTEIVVDQRGSMVMLGKRGDGNASASNYSSNSSNDYNKSANANTAPAAAMAKPAPVSDDAAFDDDIPF